MSSNKPIKIAYLLDFFPFPEDRDGATKIIANILLRLSDHYHITVIAVCPESEVTEVPDDITLIVEKPRSTFQQRLKNLFSFHPPICFTKSQLKAIHEKHMLADFDIVHTALYSFARYSNMHPNVIHGFNDSISRAHVNGTMRGKIKSYFFRQFEKRTSKAANRIFVVSEFDAVRYDQSKTHILVNGLDAEHFKDNYRPDAKESFVFHGILDFQPNLESIELMSDFLQKAGCEIELNLIGRLNRSNKKESINKFKSLPNTNLIGEVESIPAALSAFKFYLALMNSGSGIKNKVLEAMSCEKVVFLNARACEGLTNKDQLKEAAYFIETKEDLQKALSDQENWETKAKNARKYVIENYSWERYIQEVESIYSDSLKA